MSLPITPAQAKVAALAAAGFSNREIAELCSCALSTVKNHKNALYQRSAARNLNELRVAHRLGVLGDPHGLHAEQYQRARP